MNECGHHDAQVGVRFVDLGGGDVPCSWCGDAADLGAVKSERHKLALCEGCRTVLEIIIGSGGEVSEA